MHIAVVHQRWSVRGGAEKYMKNLVLALQERGHTIDLFVHFTDIPVPHSIKLKRVPLIRFPLWLRLYSYALFANKMLQNHKYDVSIGLGKVWGLDIVRPSGGCHRAYQKRTSDALGEYQHRLKSLYAMKNFLSPFQLINRYIEDKLFRETNQIIAVSELVKNDILQYYDRPEQSISVIHNGRDPIKFNSNQRELKRSQIRKMFNLPYDATIFLFVATNPLLKGIDHLLCGLNILSSSFIKQYKPALIIVGPNQRQIKQIKQLNKTSIPICFESFKADISEFYKGSDLLIHPTKYDAFANVCLEAMSYGIPVLTTHLNGGSSLYTHGENGFVIDNPSDHKHLSEIIEWAVRDTSLYHVGLKGNELLSQYSFRNNIDQVEHLIKTVASKKSNLQSSSQNRNK